jgi:hypothetical protein
VGNSTRFNESKYQGGVKAVSCLRFSLGSEQSNRATPPIKHSRQLSAIEILQQLTSSQNSPVSDSEAFSFGQGSAKPKEYAPPKK